MLFFRYFLLFLAVFSCGADIAVSIPLDSWPTWATAQPYTSKQVPPGALIVRGSGTNNYYVLEANPTTGAIPVTTTITFPYDTNYGTVGANTLRTGAQIGNATGAASFGAGTTGAQVLRVVLPTDQTAIPATQSGSWSVTSNQSTATGKAYSDSIRNVYSSTNVTTGAWVQIIAATAANINWLTIFDSCGQTLELGSGGAGVEARILIIPPGGVTNVPLKIAAATRLSLKAISGNCTTGEFDMSGLN